MGAQVRIDKSKAANVGFGMGGTVSRGTRKLTIPIGDAFVSFDIHVVDADIPILLSLADMNKHELVFLNPFNVLMHLPSGAKARVQLKFGHPFISWNRFTKCMFPINDLLNLRRRFGHPEVDKLYKLLNKAEPEKLDRKPRSRLNKIVRHFKLCQLNSQRPSRFNLL